MNCPNCPLCNIVLIETYKNDKKNNVVFHCKCNNFIITFYDNKAYLSWFKTNKYTLSIYYDYPVSYIDYNNRYKKIYDVIYIDTSIDLNSQLESYLLLL